MLLARMGVSARLQGQGIGRGLLKDAIMRTLAAADIAGIRAFAVLAKDEKARAFYERFDFIPSPTDPLHMFVLIKDLRPRCRSLFEHSARWPPRWQDESAGGWGRWGNRRK
jgi:predicted N-acetyltransferase YhbS